MSCATGSRSCNGSDRDVWQHWATTWSKQHEGGHRLQHHLPPPLDRVWTALTSADALQAWLMPNDFEPVVGRRCTLRTKPALGVRRHRLMPGDGAGSAPAHGLVVGGRTDRDDRDVHAGTRGRRPNPAAHAPGPFRRAGPPSSPSWSCGCPHTESMPTGSLKGTVLACDDVEHTATELIAGCRAPGRRPSPGGTVGPLAQPRRPRRQQLDRPAGQPELLTGFAAALVRVAAGR